MKVHFETSGPLAILALANPPLNLLSGELLDELGAAVRELKRLPIRALMLRAEGKVFSAGADVSAFKGKTESAARESFAAHQQMITDLEALPFPTLAGCSRHVCRRRAGGGARVRSHLGGCLGPLRSTGGNDRNHNAARWCAAFGRTSWISTRSRNHIHRRTVRRGNV